MKSDRLATQIADMIIADTAGVAICEEIRAAWSGQIAKDNEPWPHAEVFARLYKRLDPWDKKFAAMLRAIWDQERKIVLANLKKVKKWAHTDKLGLADIARILYASGAFKDMLTDSSYDLFIQEMKEEGQNHLDDLDIHAAFDVDNPRIQKWLTEYCPKLSKNLEEVNVEDLKRVLREGIGEGEGIPDLARRVNDLFEEYDRNRAEMIARTETIRASNQSALEAYQQSGVVEQKIWLVAEDERTCEICMEFGSRDPIDMNESYGHTKYETIYAPPAHPNCLLPGTLCISPGNIIAGLHAWYDGKAIELTFSDGSRLAVTQNHMLLTPHGFAPAYLLDNGDDVVYCSGLERIISGNPDIDRKPALIEEIVGSLSKTFRMAIRSMPVAPEYLHGDGRFVNGDIDIIGTDSPLGRTRQTMLLKGLNTYPLDSGNADLFQLSGSSDFASMLKRLAGAADSIMGGLRKPSPFFTIRAAHSIEHGFASISGLDTEFEQSAPDGGSISPHPGGDSLFGHSREIKPSDLANVKIFSHGARIFPSLTSGQSSISESFVDRLSTYIEALGELIDREAGLIQTKKVVGIKVFPYVGHVYDLQTSTSLYFANGILSSNCRCAIAAYFEET